MGRTLRYGGCGVALAVVLAPSFDGSAEEIRPTGLSPSRKPPPPAAARYWEWLLPAAAARPPRPPGLLDCNYSYLFHLASTVEKSDPQRSDYLLRAGGILAQDLFLYQLREEWLRNAPPQRRQRLAATARKREEYDLHLYPKAAQYLAEASTDLRYPRREDALVALAQLHLTMGNYPQAKISVQELSNAFPRSVYLPFLDLRLGDLEARDGKHDAARGRYLKIQRDGDALASALALYQRAWLEIGEGERRASVPLLLQAQATCNRKPRPSQCSTLVNAVWHDLLSEQLFDAFVDSRTTPAF